MGIHTVELHNYMREWSDGSFQYWDGMASKDTMWMSDLIHVCPKHKVCNYVPVRAMTPDVMNLTQAMHTLRMTMPSSMTHVTLNSPYKN